MIYDSHEEFEKFLEAWGVTRGVTRSDDLRTEHVARISRNARGRNMEGSKFKYRWRSFWRTLELLICPHPLTSEEWSLIIELKMQGHITREQLWKIRKQNQALEQRRQFWFNFRRRPLKVTWLWLKAKVNARRWGL